MKQIRAMSLFLLVLMSLGSVAAAAKDQCRGKVFGQSFAEFHTAVERVRYEVKINGKNWQDSSFSRHATGYLSCASCTARGLYFLRESRPVDQRYAIWRRPGTAAERIARAHEVVSYPRLFLKGKDLQLRATNESVRIGPFSGYAVRYRISNEWFKAHGADLTYPYLLVVSIADDCAAFETNLHTNQDNWTPVESLMREVSIVRTTDKLSAGNRE